MRILEQSESEAICLQAKYTKFMQFKSIQMDAHLFSPLKSAQQSETFIPAWHTLLQ